MPTEAELVRALYLRRQENQQLRARVRGELDALAEWAQSQSNNPWAEQVAWWALAHIDRLERDAFHSRPECAECGDREPNPDCDECWVEPWRNTCPERDA